MARKRMISPCIWTSSSFSKLSDIAKIVFIGLFSNADDGGKGYADPTFVKNTLFPRDKDKRVTDIEKALSEIALNMSIIFYEVEGDKYYYLTKWKEYQKIDRPTPSKIPNPPETMGERGRTTQNPKFDEGSTRARRILDEGSTSNRIEYNIIEYNNLSNNAHARAKDDETNNFAERLKAFCTKWDILVDSCSSYITEFDFDALDKAYAKSPGYLADKDATPWAHTLSGIVNKYNSIIAGKYRAKKNNSKADFNSENKKGIIDSWQAIHEMFVEEGKDDS